MPSPQPGVPEPQAALDRIRINENHDPLVDLRGIPNLTFRNIPGKQVIPFLRAPVAAMLEEAAARLAPSYYLYVVSALRDFAYQKQLWQKHFDRHHTEHPEWPEATIRRMVNQYVAP